MQFTTWSTLTNALIISTVALLSLIQAANALDLYIVAPSSQDGPFHSRDPVTVKWASFHYADLPEIESHATVSLVNDDFDYSYNYQQQVPIYLNLTEIFYVAKTNVALPADLRVPSGTYYFQLITSVGRFRGSHFSII